MLTVDFRKLNIKPGDTILDIGSGDGRHAGELTRMHGVTVVAADRNIDDLSRAKSRLEYIEIMGEKWDSIMALSVADITALPFIRESFDHVICAEVLEHIPDDAAAVKELIRVLKPGGNLVVSVPRYLPEKICWMLSNEYCNTDGGHIRIYTRSKIDALFKDHGMIQLAAHFAHSLHTPYWWLKCLMGLNNNDAFPVKLYRRFLTWDIMEKPKLTRSMDWLLNPLLGKSLVIYFKK